MGSRSGRILNGQTHKATRVGRERALLQALEPRVLMAITPAAPRADGLGAVFDGTERRLLLDRLTNLSPTVRSDLVSRLNDRTGRFDTGLLSYMRGRSGPKWFVDPSEIAGVGSFIANNNISYTDIRNRSNTIVDSHKFPEQSSAKTYTVQVPAEIDWVTPGVSDNPEFLHTLNRHEWWRELAWTSAITGGDAKYATEIEYELASWSLAYQTMDQPAAWSKSDKAGWQLDTAIRTESWTWAYFGFLDHSSFTGAENSLFMYKLLQSGDYLYSRALTTTDFASNRTIVLGKSLVYLGQMFPEIDSAATWETTGRSLLFRCMDAQIYDDGSHVEQSPGYAFNVADDLLDIRQFDKLNDTGWPTDKKRKLANIVDSYWQFLSPNGTRPAIGDTYRTDELGVFLKPNLVLETTRWPAAKPRPRDVFVEGVAAVTPYLGRGPAAGSLGDRGRAYAMPDSGNYVMRSGTDTNARQIVFDAGPKGGPHGHFDLLNFELSGFGRPLISDPGAFRYDTSADREYVISTRAHNTLNADGLNHAAIDTAGGSDVLVSQFRNGADFAQVTATHKAYKDIAGSPVLTRSMWFDLDNTLVIVDWAEGSVRHDYQQSFNLQTEGDSTNVFVDPATLTARTRYVGGGNVQIQGIAHNDGETAAKGPLTFVTNTVGGDFKDDAFRFRLNQSGKYVVFVTLVTAYQGRTPPNVTASIVGEIGDTGPVRVEINKNGQKRTVDFVRPQITGLDALATSRGTFNDLAFDSQNRLHLAYADRDTGALMYAVRATSGAWSVPSIIDEPASINADGGYQFVSLAVSTTGKPAVAYFDGWNGDLKYATLSSTGRSWVPQTIDSRGSTGLYPSLAFGRTDLPAISYYNRTDKNLMLATFNGSTFSIKPIDTTGDVGRSSALVLDPNRSNISRWSIGYEDTTNGNYKYALEGDWDSGTTVNGFTNYLVENLAEGGGYVSVAYYDSGAAGTRRFRPAMSYYDAGESALRFSRSTDGLGAWESEVVSSVGVRGLYSNLVFGASGSATILYFDRTNNAAWRAVQGTGSWTNELLRAGGRELHVARRADGVLFYSSLNEKTGYLTVHAL